MLSDKKFELNEFIQKVQQFAQEMANRVVDSEVLLRQDIMNSQYIDAYIVTIDNGKSNQHTLLGLNQYGNVEMFNIFGQI